MFTTAQRTTAVPTSSPSAPRLVLAPVRAGRAVLDGGWWPRSWDPLAELPGLVLALSERFGPIRRIMVNSTVWEGRFRRLAVGSQEVRMGWFASLDPAVLVAMTDRDQLDVLVVAPETDETAANAAMAQAADPANTARGPQLLAAARH